MSTLYRIIVYMYIYVCESVNCKRRKNSQFAINRYGMYILHTHMQAHVGFTLKLGSRTHPTCWLDGIALDLPIKRDRIPLLFTWCMYTPLSVHYCMLCWDTQFHTHVHMHCIIRIKPFHHVVALQVLLCHCHYSGHVLPDHSTVHYFHSQPICLLVYMTTCWCFGRQKVCHWCLENQALMEEAALEHQDQEK